MLFLAANAVLDPLLALRLSFPPCIFLHFAASSLHISCSVMVSACVSTISGMTM